MRFTPRPSHYQREDQGRIGMNLDRLCVSSDLAPADCLIWSRAPVRSIEFLASVDIDSVVCPVPLLERVSRFSFRVRQYPDARRACC
jgi:hypothetical protein